MQVDTINNSINLFLKVDVLYCHEIATNTHVLSAGLREEDLNVFRMSEYGMFP